MKLADAQRTRLVPAFATCTKR